VAVAPRGYTAGRLRRIAVAWDGSAESEDALSAGIGIALLAGATLTTFTVVAPGQARDAEPVQRATALVPEDLLEGADVLIGHPAAALSAVSIGFDLMSCGSRSHGPLRSVLLGSCSRELLHRSACPLLILPRGPQSRLDLLDRSDAAGASA
jgi:nucleotide-binding universal stress UspA family protein